MADLIERLRGYAEADDLHVDERATLLEAAAALEAAREDAAEAKQNGYELGLLAAARDDACVALVADIRFACGDNGKRMQPELVEFIRELAQDAERYRWLRQSHWYVGIEPDGDTEGVSLCSFYGAELDAAIDQSRGKGGAE